MQFHSQWGQDRFVYERYFTDKRNGVFIDIGAHDGIDKSNTLFFEREMGWTGVCLEANPTVYDRLTKNRLCRCENVAVFNQTGTVPFCLIGGYAEMLSGISTVYNPLHEKRINHELALYGGSKKIINVKADTLESIFNRNGINHVDFLSIDIEGGEFEALSSIDFSQVSIDVLTVEVNYPSDKYSMDDLLLGHGFEEVATVGGDVVYKHK